MKYKHKKTNEFAQPNAMQCNRLNIQYAREFLSDRFDMFENHKTDE